MPEPGRQDGAAPPLTAGPPSRRARLIGRLFLGLFPLLVLAVLELILRIMGVGYNPHFFVPAVGGEQGQWMTNHAFGRRFFPRALAREPEIQGMPTVKAPGAVRIFVLGESAAMGDPDAAYGLSRMLEVVLRDRLPDRSVQVVNAAMTAVNSHAILPIARDCLKADADALVVYMGNNEVVGPFGIGSTLTPFSPSLRLVRLGLAVRSLRLGQVLDATLRRAVQRPGEEVLDWRGMEHSLKQEVGATDTRLEVTQAHFRQNLEDILDAARKRQVPVILCTVPVNLRSCPPFSGKPLPPDPDWDALMADALQRQGPGLADSATEPLEAAIRRQPAAADGWFLLGKTLAQQGQAERANDCFRKARDLDRYRFRTDAALDRIIREAGAYSGVRLVDAEASLASSEAAGVDTFLDHVHLTFTGTSIMAAQVSEALLEVLGNHAVRDPPTAVAVAERCSRVLAYTEWDRLRLERDMLERRTRAPFTRQMGWQANREQRTRLELQLRQGAVLTAARTDYAAAQRVRPDDPGLCRSAARMLSAAGDKDAAARAWQTVSALQPFAPDALHNLGTLYVDMGRALEAEDLFRQALRIRPDLAEAYVGLALVRLRSGQGEVALTLLHLALAAKPGHVEARNNLAGIYIALGRVDEALVEWRSALSLKPNYTGARCNLARALWGQNRADEALAEIALAIGNDPLSPLPRLLEADILTSLGRPAAAAERLRRAFADTSENPLIAERLRQLAPSPPPAAPLGP